MRGEFRLPQSLSRRLCLFLPSPTPRRVPKRAGESCRWRSAAQGEYGAHISAAKRRNARPRMRERGRSRGGCGLQKIGDKLRQLCTEVPRAFRSSLDMSAFYLFT
eukprot:6208501-Pleurochrysis_carterae.AAC.2